MAAHVLDTQPLTVLPGVGPAISAKFTLLGIKTIEQLITYWPRRYEDYSTVVPMAAIQPGMVTVSGVISGVKSRYVRRGMHITEAEASDATGSIKLVWFNQPYRAAALKAGERYFISGTYALQSQRFSIQNPALELADTAGTNTGRIVPVYRETKGLQSRQIRAAVSSALKLSGSHSETLPIWIVRQAKLISHDAAIRAMHFPEDANDLQAAKRRIGFEEVFALSLASLMTKREQQLERALPVPFRLPMAKQFVEALPFQLTNGQRAAVWQIFKDIEREVPMNRLLEGDVGSGKTVVATMAALMALAQGYQVAFMAPTELLARQHAATIYKLLQPHGYQDGVVLLVGSMLAADKKRAHATIASGDALFVVGTQALIQDSVEMTRLALIVIDEQHRFGVDQRKALLLKAGHMPHVLSMTATPIPRSLALTLYGELDVSVLQEKPANRQEIQTELISPNSQAQLYKRVSDELTAGRQAFVVCPLISDSAASENLSSAEATYERLRKGPFKQWRIGLLHGKLKPLEKQAIMQRFVNRELDMLVATTVIEVGVDVPNATVMLIESPERFGLAQLHQLRGRVGRGEHRGYCFLMLESSKTPPRRLRALESSTDGFRLSELDLELRGPGAIYGTLQHGALDLRVAQLSDTALISAAQSAARSFLDRHESLLQYKTLAKTLKRLQTVTNLN